MKIDNKKICLNLGCGTQHFTGSWINIDIEPLKKPDLLLDITKGLPYEDDSIDEIYTSHVFEHLTLEDMVKVIKECKRVLKKGCFITIVVPDFLVSLKMYNEKRMSRKILNLVVYGDEPNKLNMHKQILDEDYLIGILKEHFDTVQKIDFSIHQRTVNNFQIVLRCIK